MNNIPDLLSLITEFEAELKSPKYYNLNKSDIQRLVAPGLRKVTSMEDFDALKLGLNNYGGVFDSKLRRAGFINFLAYIEKYHDSKDGGYNDGIKYFFIDTIQKRNDVPPLFEIQSVGLNGKDVIITAVETASGKPIIFIGKISNYLQNGLKALSIYSDNKPNNTIHGYNEQTVECGSYILQQLGETLEINYSPDKKIMKKTIDGVDFDYLPKDKSVKNDVIVNFKPRSLQLFSLTLVNNQIKAEKYNHYGFNEIDYSQYGTLLSGKLDLNKNFIVGVFQQSGQTSLKILRFNQNADLLASIPNIKEFVGYDGADIVCYDTEGNLRMVDCNFDDYILYYNQPIVSKSGTLNPIDKVTGGCKSYEEIFRSPDFAKALAFVLKQNVVLNTVAVESIINRIQQIDLITIRERDSLIGTLDAGTGSEEDNATLIADGVEFINKLTVVSPPNVKREPLYGFILKPDDTPNVEQIVSEYRKYVKKYSNIIDCDTIQYLSPSLILFKDKSKYGLKRKTDTGYTTILDLGCSSIKKTGSYTSSSKGIDYDTIEFTTGDSIGKMDIGSDGSIINKLITVDKYRNTSSFDANNVGFAQDRTKGNWGFIQIKGETIQELGSFEYSNIRLIQGGFYIVNTAYNVNKVVISGKNGISVSKQEFAAGYEDYIFQKDGISVLVTLTSNNTIGIIININGVLKEYAFDGNILGKSDWGYGDWRDLFKKNGNVALSSTKKNGPNKKDDIPQLEFVQVYDDGNVFISPKFLKILGNNVGKLLFGYTDEHRFQAYVADSNSKMIEISGANELYQGTLDGLHVVKVHNPDKTNTMKFYKEGKEGTLSADTTVESKEKLKDCDPIGLLRLKDGTELVIMKQANGQYAISDYISLTKLSQSYGNKEYYLFIKDSLYGIGYVKGGKRQEFLPASAASSPKFTTDSFTFGNDTYNLTKSGEFVKLQHEYDSVETLDGFPKTYIVKKGNKYGFATFEDGRFTAVGKASMEEKPEIVGRLGYRKVDGNYEILKWKEKGSIGDFNILGTAQGKPDMSYLDKYGYMVFEINKKFGIVSGEKLQNNMKISISGSYTNVSQNINTLQLIKEGGGCDFVYKNELYMSMEAANQLQEITTFNPDAKGSGILIGRDNGRNLGLYYSDDRIIHKISKKNYRRISEKNSNNIVIKTDGLNSEYIETIYHLYNSEDATSSDFEYIITRQIPGDSYIQFLRPKVNGKEFINDDFVIDKKGRLQFNFSLLKGIFVRPDSLESSLIHIITFDSYLKEINGKT